MKKRLFIVLLCYLLSSYGILVSILGVEKFRKINSILDLLELSWVAAWVFHLVMSVSWIKDKRLGKNVAIVGSMLGVISLILSSLFAFSYPVGSVSFVLFYLLSVLPCFLLAIYLVMYHSGYGDRPFVFLKRLFIVLLCYLLSSPEIFISIVIAIVTQRQDPPGLVWIAAWVFHLIMSVSWVTDKRLGKNVAVVGTMLGVFSLILPLLYAFDNPYAFDDSYAFDNLVGGNPIVLLISVLSVSVFILINVLPCFLLAIYLIMYHSGYGVRFNNA